MVWWFRGPDFCGLCVWVSSFLCRSACFVGGLCLLLLVLGFVGYGFGVCDGLLVWFADICRVGSVL